MVIIRAKQLVTALNMPWRYSDEVAVINDAAVVIRDGVIIDVGTWEEIKRRHPHANIWDFGDNLITPGLVDPHTHLLFAGSREDELERKLQGESYEEITRKGGGIYKTVKYTKETSDQELLNILQKRIQIATSFGTTTVEVKTGYGLDIDQELRLARILKSVKSPIDVVTTFLVHIPPPAGRENYVKEVLKAIPYAGTTYVDVFCDSIAFNVEETRTILKKAAEAGYKLRLHADELEYIGCSDLVEELPIDSADHLLNTPPENVRKIAKSGTVATLLPVTILTLRTSKKPPVDEMRRLRVPIAIGTDFSPNSWSLNMQTAIELAVYLLGLTPLEALIAATANAAYSLRLTDRGIIQPGKIADLVIWDVPNYHWLAYEIGRNKAKLVLKRGEPLRFL
ncbi:imidazolonepropionase [Pyrobaculum oguniense TE7]|uniref:Imidazolonepropionase n=1 Tax=Pyrobaculum oguniense (strain DSM 13380 / JCM 10595 / TE7) TaxID=698757 RepID=H6Q7K6_PYROT|nr:imidazolonepropionase [Pyrobaculum oguniense TE7]